MLALTVVPGVAGSARLEEIAGPEPSEGSLLVRSVALGLCATDREINAGHYGSCPPGAEKLVLGHESLGQIVSAPAGGAFSAGDVVVGIVRRPDPVPCAACAAGEWDMCRNGRYTERGIKERHGFGSELFRLEPEFAVKVPANLGFLGVLVEPASIAAKAWDHIEHIGQRSRAWKPRSLLVTGAGPIGLLAALMGVQRGLDLHVFDRHPGGRKEALVRALGGTFHSTSVADATRPAPDVVLECTGAPAVVHELLGAAAPAGIVCLLGVSAEGRTFMTDIGSVNRRLVLDNGAIFGAVNANRRHYAMAVEALTRADTSWLTRLITRRVPLQRWREALEHRDGDIKVVLEFADLREEM